MMWRHSITGHLPLPVLLLVAGLAVADGIAWPLATPLRGATWDVYLCLALAHSQVSLAAIWSVLGGTHLLLRAGVLLATICAESLLMDVLIGHLWSWPFDFVAQVAMVVGPLLLAQACGVRLEYELDATLNAASQPWQFSLRQLLAALTGAAVLLGILRMIDPDLSPWQEIRFQIAWIGTDAAIALVSVWAGLGRGGILKAFVMLVVCSALAFALTRIAHDEPAHWVFFFAMVQAALLWGSLSIVRLSGYRLRRVGMPHI